MSANTHKVAVIGVLKSNGQLAHYGEEVGSDHFGDELDARVKEGYLMTKEDFDAKAKEDKKAVEQAGLTDDEKATIKAQTEKQESDLKADNDLLDSYKTAFGTDAPSDVSDDAIAKAVKDKKPITV